MRKTFRFRLYPNGKQIKNIDKALSQACYVYNKLIERQKELYEIDGKKHSRYGLSKLSKEIKTPNLYSQVKQNISSRIDESYKLFFSNIKRGIKASPPKFRKRTFYRSLTYPQSGFKFENGNVKLSRIGNITIKQHREIEGEMKTVTIKKLPNEQYYLFVSCDEVEKKTNIIPKNETVGIDVGIKEFATLSTGHTIKYPQFLKKASKKLAKMQRKLCKKKKGSKNRNKAKIKVAMVHHKTVCQRRDFFFKTANIIAHNFRYVGVEDLKIKNMVRNHCLAKSISDNSWSKFIEILNFKMMENGGELHKVNPKYTSQECSGCGHKQKMSLEKRTYECPECNLTIDRDYNASININNRLKKQLNDNKIAVGQTVKVFGDIARPCFTFETEANINELETSYLGC